MHVSHMHDYPTPSLCYMQGPKRRCSAEVPTNGLASQGNGIDYTASGLLLRWLE